MEIQQYVTKEPGRNRGDRGDGKDQGGGQGPVPGSTTGNDSGGARKTVVGRKEGQGHLCFGFTIKGVSEVDDNQSQEMEEEGRLQANGSRCSSVTDRGVVPHVTKGSQQKKHSDIQKHKTLL